MRDRRRVIEATAAAALLSGVTSTLVSIGRHRAVGPVLDDLRASTRAAATLLPGHPQGLVPGAIAHLGVSVVCGAVLARTLPERHSPWVGASAGFTLGIVNLRLIGRRFPAITALPFVPQLADNIAFGAVFALVADRAGALP